jgi:succinate dehydrogenase (ubiquinone) flavoprotein subunit
MDEYDYKKPVEVQEKLPMDKHWRKHTLSYTDMEGNTKLDYR